MLSEGLGERSRGKLPNAEVSVNPDPETRQRQNRHLPAIPGPVQRDRGLKTGIFGVVR